MAFGRKVMRGIRRRMAQKRATQRNQQKLSRRARGNARARTLGSLGPTRVSSKQSTLTADNSGAKPIKPSQMSSQEKAFEAAMRKAAKERMSEVTPVQGRGPRRAVDPIKTGAKHSGQGRGGRGGIPSVKPIKGRGPKMIVDPLRPSKPADKIKSPQIPVQGARHSGQGRGGRGGMPDVNPFGQRRIPRSEYNKHLNKSGRINTPYFKGGSVAPTKNAIGTNDYRKTGTTLSVKDNRKKTK